MQTGTDYSPHTPLLHTKPYIACLAAQPLVDPAEITSRLNVVEALVSDAELRQKLRDQHMRGGDACSC